MASFQITIDDNKLQRLFQDGSPGAGMKHVIEQTVNAVLQAELTEHLSAEPGERTDNRLGYRNGHYKRRITTRIGKLELEVPRDREGRFRTELFNRFQRSERALVLSLMDMVIQGVSTRKVKKITRTLCGHEFSKSTVSELTKELDEQVRAWADRPLDGQNYPFVIADAMFVKVRREGRVRSAAVLIAVGITAEGHREVLGMNVSLTESETAWNEFFLHLRRRGLSGVEYVITDRHKGLVSALTEHFTGATWQRCQAHFMRNVMDHTPENAKDDVLGALRNVLHAPTPKAARRALEHMQEELEERAPKAVSMVETAFDEVTAVLTLPKKYRRRLRTSNMLERLNEEIRRRERVIRIFPNEESIFRLMGALLAEQHEAWTAGRLYLNMDEYHSMKEQTTTESESTAIAA